MAPIAAIFVIGSASFYFMVQSRSGQGHGPAFPERVPADGQWPRETASDQTFSRR